MGILTYDQPSAEGDRWAQLQADGEKLTAEIRAAEGAGQPIRVRRLLWRKARVIRLLRLKRERRA